MNRALPGSVRQQSSPFIEQTDVPGCEHPISIGAAIPEIRQRLKLADIKINSPNDNDIYLRLILLLHAL
ncbi:MAG: hypothetical protein LUQ44_01015, partial [Methanothrix sp.]|nr:hypothetical protein [Methanothrix sp.]